ncbi:hypothetical protein N9X12_01075 [Alphaproteobacteria bacterium]|nr:hypothetical protein [Alphaproteobacteria bacterium]
MHRIQREIKKFNFEYILLRDPFNWDLVGDIDLLVQNLDQTRNFLLNNGYTELTDKYSPNNNLKFIKLLKNSDTWMHLDIHLTLDCPGITWPNNFIEVLLKEKIKDKFGIYTINKSDKFFLHLLHLSYEKKIFSEKYMHLICNLNKSMSQKYDFLPQQFIFYSSLVDQYLEGQISINVLLDSFSTGMNTNKKKKINLISRSISRLKSIINYDYVVFLGPDGSGKSSITKKFSTLKWPKTKVDYMGPMSQTSMNSFLYLILNVLNEYRFKYKLGSTLGNLVRIIFHIFCYFDFLLRLYRNLWLFGSGHLIIYDRYACDMFFRRPNIFLEIIYLRFFPKPKNVFLCVGDAKEIYRRKPDELSENEITQTISLYRKYLTKYAIQYIELDTTKYNVDDCVNLIINNVTTKTNNKKI